MKLIVPKMLLSLPSVAGGGFVLVAAYGQDAGRDASKSEATQSRSAVSKGEDGVAVEGYEVVSKIHILLSSKPARTGKS